MLCSKPYRQGVAEFGCGQCLPCRFNKKRLWAGRLVLESFLHPASHFVTLTYDDLHVPKDGSVRPRELQLFLKRLRERSGERVRYYGVGEYGDLTQRPHYHLALFGLESALEHYSPGDAEVFGLPPCGCVLCVSWARGGVDRGDLTPESAAYIAGYIAKGLTADDHPELGERYQEFSRMSRKPGIGADAVPALAKAISDAGRRDYQEGVREVPSQYRQEKRLRPLGRYLGRRFREALGVSDETHASHVERHWQELQSDLQAPGARAKRESERTAVGLSALAKYKIANSKKGIGI